MDNHNHSTTMISGERVVIKGGNFTQNFAISDQNRAEFTILKDNVAHTAFHDSGARFDPPKCHPNTRVAVLKKIMDWARHSDWDSWYRHIMWLTGAAGAGKSAIAQSIIELCIAEGLVVASFFFFRSDGTRNHGKSLISTIAYQIFFSVPAAQHGILSAIGNDPLIFTKTLHHQFNKLIIQPLRNSYKELETLDEPWNCGLVVIDGLDECLDPDTQRQILNMLCDEIHEYRLPIIFLVASRPEHAINTVFNSKPMAGIYARLYLDDTFKPDDDIRTFLTDSFEEIKTSHPFKSQIPVSWPIPEAISSIVKKSSGQFIYAATVVRYVRSIRRLPHHQLDIVLNLRPAEGDLPFAQLDALYTLILSSAENIERVLYVLSVYSLPVVSLFDIDIVTFMSLGKGELDILFCDLQALVTIDLGSEAHTWIPTQRIRNLHASLHDFLLDPVRSKDYFINIENYRTRHVTNILQYLAEDLRGHVMDARVLRVSRFFEDNFPVCKSSTDLIKQASSFPLAKTFFSAFESRSTNIAGFLKFTLLAFFRKMAYHSETWSFIERQQLDQLDQIFLYYIPTYYQDDSLTALICLVCNAGTEILVPCLDENNNIFINLVDSNALNRAFDYKDKLHLASLTCKEINEPTDQYRQCLIRFLKDPERSGSYAIGVDAYTQATIFFIKELQSMKWRNNDLYDENWMSSLLFFDNGTWKLSTFTTPGCNHPWSIQYRPTSISCFVYLGYLISFLPRAGKSGALIRHGQRQHTFITGTVAALFPTRTALVRQAIEEYLERVGTA